MCGRYLTPDAAALERYWRLPAPAGYTRSYNLAPTQPAPLVRADEQGRPQLGMIVWGFRPPWAERSWINARSETVFTTKAFAAAARKRRCLVPAAGWYEWQGEEAPRQPFVFHLDGFAPFAFAGIWTARETEEGWQRSFAILTTAAHGPFREIHPRKPLVLAPECHDLWMDRGASVEALEAAMRRPVEGFTTYAVTPYVNKPANDEARCIEPLVRD